MILHFCSGLFIFCSFVSLVPSSNGFILPILSFFKSDSDSPANTTTFGGNFTSPAAFSSPSFVADSSTIGSSIEDAQNSSLLITNETTKMINVVYYPTQNGENFTTDLIKYFSTASENGVSWSLGPGIAVKNPTLPPLYGNLTFYGNDSLNATEAQNFSIPVATSFRDEIVAFFDKPQIHRTTLIILVCIGIFGVLSTFLLVVWRFKWSGLSGEWVLHDDYARKQPHIAAFDNDCFSMDSKTNHSCSYNFHDKKCPPFEHEMMELVENSFRGDSQRM